MEEARHIALSCRIPGLGRHLELAEEYAPTDPYGSLNKCRSVVENILKDLHKIHVGAPDPKVTLGPLLDHKVLRGLIPPVLHAQMVLIHRLGNLGSHLTGMTTPEVVTADDARLGVSQTQRIVDWYLSAREAPTSAKHSGLERTRFGLICDVNDLPERRESKRIVAGEPPRLVDLAESCFMQREVLSASLAELEGWYGQNPTSKIPVFWIIGRSGDGKSVLLLQLVEAFLRTDPSRRVLFASNPDSLLALLEVGDPTKTYDLVVFDDLHRLSDESQCQRFEDACRVVAPSLSIMTAGPTEQAHWFQRRLGSSIHALNFRLPPLGNEEQEALARWYANRAGVPAIVGVKNRLAVQVAFESARGTGIADFARRFRDRLESLDLFDVSKLVVMATCCDAGFPMKCVPRESRDGLERLCEEDQLHFYQYQDADGESRIVMGHARLAGLLLQTWLEGLVRPERAWARTLMEAINAESEAGLSPRLLLAFFRSSNLSAEAPNWQSMAMELLKIEKEVHGGIPNERLFAWSSVVIVRDLTGLQSEILDRIVATLNEPDQDSRIIANGYILSHKLDRNVDIFDQWFNEHIDDPELGLTLPQVLRSVKTRLVKKTVERWLRHHSTSPQAGALLQTMIARQPGKLVELRSFLLQWCEINPTLSWTPWVLVSLIAHSKGANEVREIAFDWITQNTDHEAVDTVLTAIAKAFQDQKTIDAILFWDSYGKAEVPTALSTALAAHPGHFDLLNACARWIQIHSSDKRTPNLLCTLLKAGHPRARNIAASWLETANDANAVSLVLGALGGAFMHDSTLTELLLHWIRSKRFEIHGATNLGHLLKRSPKDGRIRDECLTWIVHIPKNATDGFIPTLLRYWGDNALVHDAVGRLIDNGTAGDTSISHYIMRYPNDERSVHLRDSFLVSSEARVPLLNAIITAYPEGVIGQAVRDWIDINTNNRIAVDVLRHYVRRNCDSAEVVAYAHAWFDANLRHEMADTVLVELVRKKPWGSKVSCEPSEGTLQRALTWVLANPKLRSVGYLLPVLLSNFKPATAPPQLLSIALDWLQRHPDHKRAGAIFENLDGWLDQNQYEAFACSLSSGNRPPAAGVLAALGRKKARTPDELDYFVKTVLGHVGKARAKLLITVQDLLLQQPEVALRFFTGPYPWPHRRCGLRELAKAINSGRIAENAMKLPYGEEKFLQDTLRSLKSPSQDAISLLAHRIPISSAPENKSTKSGSTKNGEF